MTMRIYYVGMIKVFNVLLFGMAIHIKLSIQIILGIMTADMIHAMWVKLDV